jgi:hypothetical protein
MPEYLKLATHKHTQMLEGLFYNAAMCNSTIWHRLRNRWVCHLRPHGDADYQKLDSSSN